MTKLLSRRSVTTGMLAAVTAIPAVGLAKGAKEASELPVLIKAHRAAYRAFCNAIDRQNKIEEDEARKPTEAAVPCLMAGEAYSIKYGREFCEEHLGAAYNKQRERLKGLARVAPDLAKQAEAVIDAKEADNKVLLESILAEEQGRKEASSTVRTPSKGSHSAAFFFLQPEPSPTE